MTAPIQPPVGVFIPPTPPFLLSIDVAAGSVSVHGELDRRHVERFLDAVTVLLYSPADVWTIDASGLTFCDASGLRALLSAHQLAAEAGRGFRVARPGPLLSRLLSSIGLPPAASFLQSAS